MENNQILQFVTFKIGKEEYAVNILHVQEIIKMQEISTIPNSPRFVEGILNLRGGVIPIINFRKKLFLSEKEHDSHTSIIVLNIKGTVIGFIVDIVNEVIRVSNSVLETPPQISTNSSEAILQSIAKLEDRLLLILNLEKLLSFDEIEIIKKIKD